MYQKVLHMDLWYYLKLQHLTINVQISIHQNMMVDFYGTMKMLP